MEFVSFSLQSAVQSLCKAREPNSTTVMLCVMHSCRRPFLNNDDVDKNHARYDFRVRVVDIPAWIESSFSMQDYVILKMDVEGAEHGILEQLVKRGVLPLIDVLAIECHVP